MGHIQSAAARIHDSFWIRRRFEFAGKEAAGQGLVHRLDILGELIGLGRMKARIQAMLEVGRQGVHIDVGGLSGGAKITHGDIPLVTVLLIWLIAATRYAHVLLLLCQAQHTQAYTYRPSS